MLRYWAMMRKQGPNRLPLYRTGEAVSIWEKKVDSATIDDISSDPADRMRHRLNTPVPASTVDDDLTAAKDGEPLALRIKTTVSEIMRRAFGFHDLNHSSAAPIYRIVGKLLRTFPE
jgi:hypothetical protein